MKKFIGIAVAILIFTSSFSFAIDQAKAAAEKSQQSAQKAQESVKTAHAIATALKKQVQHAKHTTVQGNQSEIINALSQIEKYADQLVQKLVNALEETTKAATHAEQTTKQVKQAHQIVQEAKGSKALVDVQAFGF